VSKDLFIKDHTIYWPEKYEAVVEFLKGGHGRGGGASTLFQTNAEVIVFAAAVGVSAGERATITDKRKEISLSTFILSQLANYIFVIPLLDRDGPNLELLRDESGENECVKIFEEYAAGGLQILNEEYSRKGLVSPFMFVSDVLGGGLDDKNLERQKVKDISVSFF
jgi:dnd system-associated protein 4